VDVEVEVDGKETREENISKSRTWAVLKYTQDPACDSIHRHAHCRRRARPTFSDNDGDKAFPSRSRSHSWTLELLNIHFRTYESSIHPLLHPSMASFVTTSPTATTNVPADPPAKEYRCTWGNCSKSFSRAEHLHRHALNHDETKGNFTCQRCQAVFRRRDLLGK